MNKSFSNLIKQATKPPKEHVLNILQAAYPKSQLDSILPIFDQTVDTNYSLGKDWKLPIFIDGKPPRFLILAGLGHIDFFKKLLADENVQKRTKQFLFIENNPETIRHLINEPFFVSILASPRFRIIFNADATTFKPMLFNILKDAGYSRIMECGQFFLNEFETDPNRRAFYESLYPMITETIDHIYHNYGRIDDSLEGVKASLDNKDDILGCPGIEDLRDKAKGRVAAIVAAGPSLDAQLPVLASNKDKFVIFAADAAVKPLLKAGIEPHYTTSIERGNIYQLPFWKGLPEIKSELVFYPVVHPEVLKTYPGPKRVVYRNYSYFAYFQHSWPKGILSSGGSTTHLSFNLARFMGCEDYVFIGMDNAYEGPNENGLFRSHANNLGYEDWASWEPIEWFSKEKNHAPPFKVEAMDGSEVTTNLTYNQWAKETGETILFHGLAGKVYITCPKATKVAGATYQPLETLVRSIETPQTPFINPKAPTPNSFRIWEHRHLIESIDGWDEAALKIREFTEAASKLSEASQQLTVANQIYTYIGYKLERDCMFMGFIIQSCAKEYYQLQNAWFAADEERPESLFNVLNQMSHLYHLVITKLRGILSSTDDKKGTSNND